MTCSLHAQYDVDAARERLARDVARLDPPALTTPRINAPLAELAAPDREKTDSATSAEPTT